MTASSQNLIGLGMPPSLANRVGNNVVTYAGAGTAQTGATAIRQNTANLTTSGGQTAFILSDVWNVGDEVALFNTSATAALIFPQVGGAINGGSTDASVSLAQNTGQIFVKMSATAWRSVNSAAVGGAITADSITGSDSSLGITGLAAAQGGAVVVTGGTSSTSGNAGGAASMVGGTPGATGVGGAASVTGGIGGATSGAGGVATLAGGAGTAGNGSGGAAIVAGGVPHGSGKVGAVFTRGAATTKTQAAPAAKTVTAAITAAELVAGLITTTGATAPSEHQLPTGTLIDAELPGIATGDSFDFSIINTGTGASDDATITVNTDVTIVGNPTVGALTDATTITGSGLFRARRSAANTYVVYRIA